MLVHQKPVVTSGDGAPAPKRLRLMCVGAGRDGSTTLAHMLQEVFDRAGGGQQAVHEYATVELHDLFADYRETQDPQYLSAASKIIADCPYSCIVGNGYAGFLDLFGDIYGRGLRVIHLRRLDRARCIESLRANCELFPGVYRYYSAAEECHYKRMAAFHFGEMSFDNWSELPIEDKFGWYYDKTHTLIDDARRRFDTFIEVNTETLNARATRQALARLAIDDEGVVPAPAHLNCHFFGSTVMPTDQRQYVHGLLQGLNLLQLSEDNGYLVEYAVDTMIRSIGNAEPLPDSVERAERALLHGLAAIRLLRERTAAPGNGEPRAARRQKVPGADAGSAVMRIRTGTRQRAHGLPE